MYAGDLLLLSVTLTDLQTIVDICVNEFNDIDLNINLKKSVCMRIGSGHKLSAANIRINNSDLPWKSELRYLGVSFLSSNSLKSSLQAVRQKFFRALNGIFGKIGVHSSVSVTLSLVNSFCVPILAYGMEAFNFTRSMYGDLEAAYTAVFSKNFGSYVKQVIK